MSKMVLQSSFLFRALICLGSLFFLTAFTSPQIVKQKAQLAVERLKEWVAEGRDVSAIIPKMKRVKVLGKSGKLNQANKLLDEILQEFAAGSAAARRIDKSNMLKGPYVVPVPVSIVGYYSDAMEPFISRDGRFLFFNDLTKSRPHKDVFWAVRETDTRFRFKGPVKNVNSDTVDGVPSMDRHNNFYFISLKKYNWRNGFVTVYGGYFNGKTGAVNKIKSHPELSLGKAGWVNMDVEISEDGQTLYLTQSYFPRGKKFPTESYFVYARKVGAKFVLQKDSSRIFRKINNDGMISGDGIVYAASISNDEKTFFFTRATERGQKVAVFRSYMAKRATKDAPFGKPELLPAITGFAEAPAISSDENRLYFHKQLNRKADGSAGRLFHIMMLRKR